MAAQNTDGAEVKDKVVLIGHVDVGKTSLFLRLKEGKFHEDAEKVVMKQRDALFTKIFDNGSQITLYDTAGMEKYQSTLPPTYFRQARAIIFVYAINDEESFTGLNNWLDNVAVVRDTIRVIVGNKTDLSNVSSNKCVDSSTAAQWASNNDIDSSMVFRVSAKSGDQVMEMFQQIADIVCPKSNRRKTAPPEQQNGDGCCNKK